MLLKRDGARVAVLEIGAACQGVTGCTTAKFSCRSGAARHRRRRGGFQGPATTDLAAKELPATEA